jgi:hypothetical protein
MLTKILSKFLGSQKRNTTLPKSTKPDLFNLLIQRSLEDTANFVEENLSEAVYRPTRDDFFSSVFNVISNDNPLICEFGVWKGRGINYLARKFPQVIVNGFDSFSGLPEKWAGNDLDKGYFNLNGVVPNIEKNVKLYVGNFDDTIPKFMKEILNSPKIDLLVIDCDIYSSTETVLTLTLPKIKKGSVLVFDEYFGYPGWRQHEHRAFIEFISVSKLTFEYLFFRTRQVCIRIT